MNVNTLEHNALVEYNEGWFSDPSGDQIFMNPSRPPIPKTGEKI